MNFKNHQEFTSKEVDILANLVNAELSSVSYLIDNSIIFHQPEDEVRYENLKSLFEKLCKFEPVDDNSIGISDSDFMWQSIYRLEDNYNILKNRLSSLENDLDDGK